MQCFTSLSFSHDLRLPVLPVRRGSVRRCSSLRRTRTTPLARPAVTRRRIASIDTAVSCAVHCWALCTAEVHTIYAATVTLQFVDDACELVLESVDALRNDLIRIETTDCFDIVEEAGWDCVVVEGFVGVGRATVKVDALLVLGPKTSVSDTYSQQGQRKYIPFFVWVFFEPIVQVVQLVCRIVLESYRSGWCPFRMLLCDALLRDTLEVYRLASP
jgi:hypothetical protein